MRTNKKVGKGFTLIELLAVIVILAIIALIATPLIMNIISEAKKGAFEDSSYAIIAAAEQGYAT
ncbi:MAG: prepilin-type N-terminal cleavage/methylation domain-containing protein, partial [Bacilli bacterium]|nr:prepilin-type N-terminal cleavage/methylation domain-containing protein [Bacilli bacterium]